MLLKGKGKGVGREVENSKGFKETTLKPSRWKLVLYLVAIESLLLTIYEVPFYSRPLRSFPDRPEGLPN